MLGLVRHVQACRTFSRITKPQYLWEELSYFIYLLHVVTHLWKLQCYHIVLIGYCPACPKFSEITNRQYPWKVILLIFCMFLDIHKSYKNMLFWVVIVRHMLSTNQIVRCFKLKRLEKYMRYKVFCFRGSYKNVILFWVMTPKYPWPISFLDFLLLTCLTC